VTAAAPSLAEPGSNVQLLDLHRSYGEVHALDGLTLEVAPGRMLALLGPSGCGKTTALRALAGLEELDRGRVVVGGRDLTDVPANRRDMGMVFQAYSLFPHLTALENVAFGLRMRRVGAAERRRRAGEALELVGLGQLADRYAGQMSGGQQQRVALARALAIRPSVLLLDEPLSALDARVRTQLRDEIRRIQLEVGTTAVFVTHDQEEALAVADEGGVMQAGRLEQLAPPQEVYDRPATPFVAQFVGLTSRIPASVRDGRAVTAGGEVPLLPGSADGDVDLLVRPESVTVTGAGENAGGRSGGGSGRGGSGGGRDGSGARGRVVATSFLGALARVTIATEQEGELLAQMPAVDAGDLSPGTPVTWRLTPAPALAVPAARP
jgi:putative spermidine/putrescine transport system ATP-binding protein